MVLKGWELSPDRKSMYDKIVSEDDLGETLLTSKCKLGREHGLIVVSNNGFAWRLKIGFNTPMYKAGTSKFVRWHDVADIKAKSEDKGVLLIECYKRKKGTLVNKGGKPKTFRWKATLERNKDEDKGHFVARRKDFYRLMKEIYERNKVEQPPEVSDSRM